MTITFGGLATGLDTNALIDGLMAVENIPLTRNKAEQSEINAAISTLSTLISTVNQVKVEAEKLDTDSEFASLAASSTDSEKVIATATGSALPGSYSVNVKQLALETRTQSNSFADSTSALTQTGSIQINVGGFPAVNVAVGATDSLADVAANINASDARVVASIIYDGSSSSRLLVRGIDTGTVNAVSYTETGTTLGLDSTSFPANTYQNAQNSQIVVDGQFTIERATNVITGVIPGVTLTLNEAHALSSDTETVTIETDAAAQEAKIQAFVDAYNNAVSAGHLASGFGGIDASNPQLAGDGAIRSSLDALALTISSEVTGLSGTFTMLASVGVNLTQGGSLVIDSSKLSDALQDDAEAVAKVFAGDPDNSVNGMMDRISDAVDNLTKESTSTLESRKSVFEDQVERLKEEELSLERRLADYETRLRKKFTELELLVSQIQQQGSALSGFTSFLPQTSNKK